MEFGGTAGDTTVTQIMSTEHGRRGRSEQPLQWQVRRPTPAKVHRAPATVCISSGLPWDKAAERKFDPNEVHSCDSMRHDTVHLSQDTMTNRQLTLHEQQHHSVLNEPLSLAIMSTYAPPACQLSAPEGAALLQPLGQAVQELNCMQPLSWGMQLHVNKSATKCAEFKQTTLQEWLIGAIPGAASFAV